MMASFRKITLVLLLMSVLGMVLGEVAFAGDTPEIIRIGALYPITGPLSVTGIQFVQALKVMQDLVNESYDIDSPGDIFRSEGLPNLGGAKIQMIFGDTEAKPEVGKGEAERLLTLENCVALIGCYNSSVTDPASAVAEAMGIPFLDDSATAPTLTERGFKYFFRTTPTDVVHVEGMLEMSKYLKENYGLSKVAIVCEDTLFGQDTAKLLVEKAPEIGYEVVVNIAYPHEATDVDAEALRVKRENPDLIWAAMYITDAILYQKAFKKYDVAVPIVANSTGHIRYEFQKSLDSDVNGVMATQLWSDSLIETNKMASIFTGLLGDRYGEAAAMGNLPARGFIGLLTLVDAINRAGSTDPDAVRQALVETDIPGDLLPLPWQGVRFDETGQNYLGRVVVIQWQNEQQKVVWPEEFAEAELVFPLPPWDER